MSDDHLFDDLLGDAAGAVVPLSSGVGKRAAKLVRQEWGRLASRALRAAEVSSGLSREDLAEWLERDPSATPLFLKVLWAAGMNGHDATLRAMGAVLGEASRAESDEDLSRAELALQAMASLGPLHFKVLAVLDQGTIIVDGESENFREFIPSHVAEVAGLSEPLASQCLLNLANAGLANLLSVMDANAFPITDLGRAVLRAAEQVS